MSEREKIERHREKVREGEGMIGVSKRVGGGKREREKKNEREKKHREE